MSNLLNLKGLYWTWLSILVLFVDFISKMLIVHNFYIGEKLPLFPLVNLYYVRNYGVAFGIFSNINVYWRHYFLISTTIVICFLLLLLMYQSTSSKKLSNIAYALILGGALGNLLDRSLHAFVVDMIDIYIYDWHFATFNLADSAIFLGTILIFLETF